MTRLKDANIPNRDIAQKGLDLEALELPTCGAALIIIRTPLELKATLTTKSIKSIMNHKIQL